MKTMNDDMIEPNPDESGEGEPQEPSNDTLVKEIDMLREVMRQMHDELTKLQGKYGKLATDYNNLHSDYQDTLKRNARAVEDAKKYSCSDFANVVISGLDMIRAAMDVAKSSPEIYEGLRMVYTNMDAELSKYGISKIQCVPGTACDPNLHCVIDEVATQAHPPGALVEVLREGYVIYDRVLRPASVIVAKSVEDAS